MNDSIFDSILLFMHLGASLGNTFEVIEFRLAHKIAA